MNRASTITATQNENKAASTHTTSTWSFEGINQDLAEASKEIQSAFAKYSHDHSSKSINDKLHPAQAQQALPRLEPDANPVNLLNRIAALESTLKQLSIECDDYVRRRSSLAQEVTSLLLENFQSIEELTVLTKGKKATLDERMKQFAIETHIQNQLWKQSSEYEAESAGDDHNESKYQDSSTTVNVTGINEEASTIDDVASLSMDGTSFIDDTGTIIITQSQFQSVPPSKRGRCRLEHVQNIASFIYEETMARYSDGYRGRRLSVDRQQIAKHSGGVAGLYSVIMNHSLWRDIVSTLQFLGFVRVEADGCLIMTGCC